MDFASKDRATSKLVLFVISAGFVIGNFLWQGHTGFNLGDEGFLWYGARQIVAGEIPIRDFMAYDPGRYYWSAAYLSIVGNSGIIALRASVALFQLLGMFAGLWTISLALRHERAAKRFFYLCVSAITLMAWMYPRHKVFDISISMIIVAAIAYLVTHPSRARYFSLGLTVGLAAVFGRNHGVYGAVASLIAIFWLTVRTADSGKLFANTISWGAGVFVGYLPVIMMCVVIPGYFKSFIDTIIFMIGQGNTNLPLPIPWPWTVGFGTAGASIEARWFMVGLCFIALIGFGAGILCWVFKERIHRRPVRPEFVAVACTALPYSHYAFARADVGHLAQAIYPLLIGVLIAAATIKSWSLKTAMGGLVAALSIFILVAWQPGTLANTQSGWERVNVSGSSLLMDPGTVEAVKLLRGLTGRYSPDGRSVLVLPFWPGAYPLLDRHAPLWEIYALSPRGEDFQLAEIDRIKKANPGFALILNMPVDGREDLRFANSHKLIDEYIRSHFVLLPDSPNSAFEIYKARDAVQNTESPKVGPIQTILN